MRWTFSAFFSSCSTEEPHIVCGREWNPALQLVADTTSEFELINPMIVQFRYGTGFDFPTIKIALKWDAATKCNAIKDLKRVSRPGLRQYTSVDEMPRVLNGLGIAILSTSKGIMTDAKARKERVGGELLCYVF